ncbi:hypothetical protein [Prosthecobacter sp.]|uniref:hypothetical protein n=1 Tax=Prosthecobacter sp. TaxID=1965333 RepID=UPI0037837442
MPKPVNVRPILVKLMALLAVVGSIASADLPDDSRSLERHIEQGRLMGPDEGDKSKPTPQMKASVEEAMQEAVCPTPDDPSRSRLHFSGPHTVFYITPWPVKVAIVIAVASLIWYLGKKDG